MPTAVAVALPTIQSHFDASLTGIQWVVNAQLLALAPLLLVGGSLGDRYGRKRIFSVGMIVFVAGALLAGVAARNIGLLIAFQAIQGVGAALMIPQTLAIINVCFVEGERGRAIGLWAGLSAGIAALGPWLGGWLVETFVWQAVFLLAVPLLAIAFVITSVFVPENREPGAWKPDWQGAVLALLGLLGITYGLITGPADGWSAPHVAASLGLGVASLALFTVVESRRPQPLLPLGILKNRLVAGANVVTFLLYFALYGVIFFLVLRLQQIEGYSPTTAGLAMLPPMVLITFLAAPAGALADRIGPRLQMVLGPATAATGIALLTVGGPGAEYVTHFLPGLVLLGAGMSLTIAPLTKSALAVEPELSGAASGFNNSVSRIASLMTIAVLGAIALFTFSSNLDQSLGLSALTDDQQAQIMAQSDRLGGIEIPNDFGGEERILAESAVRDSFVHSFRWSMGIGAALAFTGALVSLVTIRGPRLSRGPAP
jgi:EmrB/QacA subfamily drug resistance transporter